MPLEYKKVIPENKYITNNNPPQLQIELKIKKFKKYKLFSDEGDGWKTDIKLNNRKLFMNFSINSNLERKSQLFS